MTLIYIRLHNSLFNDLTGKIKISMSDNVIKSYYRKSWDFVNNLTNVSDTIETLIWKTSKK